MKKFILFLLVLTFFVSTTSCSEINPNQNCTIFTASNEETVFYANNEDTHYGDLIIGFFPPAGDKFGSVRFGYLIDSMQSFQGAVNDKGLVWDVNSVPKTKLNPHPEKKYSHAIDNYLTLLTRYVATVEEAILLADEFDFGDSMALQFHIADASGDAVVIGPGSDGEIAYTRKGTGDRYLISTNFSLADDGKNKCRRYDTASEMLSSVGNSEYTVDFISSILEEVSLRTITSFTLYSNIIDLTNKKIYLYYMSQYGERAELDMAAELAKGQRVVEMRSLFNRDTIKRGDEDFNRFELRFTIYKIAVVALGILVLASIVTIILLIRKKRRKQHE